MPLCSYYFVYWTCTWQSKYFNVVLEMIFYFFTFYYLFELICIFYCFFLNTKQYIQVYCILFNTEIVNIRISKLPKLTKT